METRHIIEYIIIVVHCSVPVLHTFSLKALNAVITLSLFAVAAGAVLPISETFSATPSER